MLGGLRKFSLLKPPAAARANIPAASAAEVFAVMAKPPSQVVAAGHKARRKRIDADIVVPDNLSGAKEALAERKREGRRVRRHLDAGAERAPFVGVLPFDRQIVLCLEPLVLGVPEVE